MVLPPLSEFILSIPASSVTATPDRWLEDCLIYGAEYLVLTDADHLPVRAHSLHHLLSMVDATNVLPILSTSTNEIRDVADPVSTSWPGLLPTVELGLLHTTVSTGAAVRMIAATPHLCWVAVDSHQRYQGLIDITRLLAMALIELADEERDDSAEAAAVDIQTSKSNTALLTYLGHELKTPLTSLLGLSSLLKGGGLGELSSRQHRYIALIQQHCRRLSNWVNTLIDLGRIESGTLKLIPQVVDLNTIWHDAYHQVVLRIGQEGQPTTSPPVFAEPPESPVTLVADPNRLQQMLSCLMQTALVAQSAAGDTDFALKATLWNHWLAFSLEGLEDSLCLEPLSQTAFTLPFPVNSLPSTPISAEMGHWLEWLLVRKLAQYHRGELVFAVHQEAAICPTLLLPKTPATATSTRESRFLLVVAPLNLDSLDRLWQQAQQLRYRLLITPHIKDAIEIATYLPLSAVLVLIQSGTEGRLTELQSLQTALAGTESLLVGLVPPQQSALMGELPVDRELLWPADRLGSVLLQPPPMVVAPNRLTILYLRSADPVPADPQKFPNVFHDFGCRVLEVDDLEQASLLRRVWKPQVAVLAPEIATPAAYLENFSHFADLNSLPLVTLTMASTQAAYTIPNLSVFPCLVEEASWSTPEAVERLSSWLIQVLQVAANSFS
jgi:signal transduction histidine kinase